MAKIIKENNILKGPNFAGLSGNSTLESLHTLHNIIEDAKDNKKELWVAFQDMAKAFDSISLTTLELVLKKINLSNNIIQLIIGLFKNRKIRVLTQVGATDYFNAKDGIDQGEALSPLIWRIFYDPLLCRITQEKDLGYSIENYNTCKNNNSYAVLAYADDTAWIGSNRDNIIKIIDISEQFYKINDININGNKSEIIILNSQLPIE